MGSVSRPIVPSGLAAIVVLAAALACGGSGDEQARHATRWNVVLVLADTLRADHLGLYGYARDTTPQLDRFAARAVVFDNARAQAPCTFPSANSLLTSRDPSAFENQLELMIGIPAAIPSAAEILAQAGYRTLAVSASVVVRDTRSSNNFHGGFGRGFEVFDESCEEAEAACVNRRALALLDEASDGDERPVFLYLHYVDPHDPYQPPPTHRWRFAKPYRAPRHIALGDPNPIARRLARRGGKPGISERDAAHLVDLYDEEVAYLDSQFGLFLDELRARGWLDHTLVIFLSDHGEDLLERNSIKHCLSLRDTQIRTPLIVSVPGVEGGRVVHAAAGNIDVLPTVLDYLEIERPDLALEGSSLRPLIEGGDAGGGSERTAFSSWQVWRAAVRGQYKLKLHLPSGSTRLYDLSVDPKESRDLSEELPEMTALLLAAIDERWERVDSAPREPSDGPDDTVERLKALGYLE